MNCRKFLFLIFSLFLTTFLCVGCSPTDPDTVTEPEIETTQPITSLELTVTDDLDLSLFDTFPDLEYIKFNGTGITPDLYEALREKYAGCEIDWELLFQGSSYPLDTQSLTVSSLTDEDVYALDYLTGLKDIFAWDCTDYPQLLTLQQRHPDATVYYTVNGTYSHRTTHITTTGSNAEALSGIIPYLPQLSSVTLTPPFDSGTVLFDLYNAFPDIEFHWELSWRDMTIGTQTTELDLSSTNVTVAEVEAILPFVPNLTRLELSHTGISNEELDALNRRHENVKVVWTVYIGSLALKTDATSFMPGKYYVEVFTTDVYNLRYCTDMECLDLGHMKITNCDFAAYMPQLKYLMLADTRITDLTPLTGLSELIYLELFMSPVSDYTPLTTLTALEDLNLYFTYGSMEPLCQMTWLNNLWWRTWEVTDGEIAALTAALPDTHVECRYAGSTANGWRQLPNYYAQRDIFEMEYMTE